MPLRTVVISALVLLAVVGWGAVMACSGDVVEEPADGTKSALFFGDRPTQATLMELGRRIFFDRSLSASGRLACASCHDPKHAYGPPDDQFTLPGGPAGDRLGFRNTPALRYLHSPVAFTEHFLEPEVNGSLDDQGPTGGRTWDGRVDRAHAQALMPLFDANEMANKSMPELAQRLRQAAYADSFRQAFSPSDGDIFDDPAGTVGWVAAALAAFEQGDPDFHPFSSKYDAYLRDQVDLSPSELRGLRLFNDQKKGNCASCHPSTHKDPARHFPMFTDFGYLALAVPRNREAPANKDPDFFDLGLCGPLRRDLTQHPEYCGMFRTPTLRNVALRKRFFHNGAIRSLRDAVDFYATRETHPARWYGIDKDGKVRRYDDLPQQYWVNVNQEPPFRPMRSGKSRLNDHEIDDIVAFLQTLTDGWKPPVPPGEGVKPQTARVK